MGGESPVSAYLVEPQTSRLHSAPTDVFGPFVGTDHAGTFIKLLLLDPEVVPVQKLGKMTLNRNPDNFFAETEQAAFHIGHIVPGIDFTNDPLLQGRLFSYTDTQLLRLGGPNFHEIPINRPLCPFHNNQRDAFHRQTINKGHANYEPNSIDSGWPKETPPAAQAGCRRGKAPQDRAGGQGRSG